SNSTLGGKGFNEFRFNDTKGKEQIFFHAQRNMDMRVNNDSMERVIGNRHMIVGWKSSEGEEADGAQQGGDLREMVYQDKQIDIKRHHIEQIEGNMQLTVGNGEASDGGDVDVMIVKDKRELIGNDSSLRVMKNRSEKIEKNLSLTVGSDQRESISGNCHIEVI